MCVFLAYLGNLLNYRIITFVKVFLCSLCDHVASRRFRIESHGTAVHGIGAAGKQCYLKRCNNLSKRGHRFTSRSKVLKLMGPYATSKNTYLMVENVLKKHMIHVSNDGLEDKAPPVTKHVEPLRAGPCLNQTPVGFPHASANATGALLQVELCDTTTVQAPRCELGQAFSHPFSPHGRGHTSAMLKRIGLVHTFVGVELCVLSKIYMKLHDAALSDRQLGAQQLHRFIEWATREGNCTEEAAISSESLARQFELKVRDVMMPNSIKNHCNSILEMIKLCSTRKQLAAAFPPSQRQSLNRARDEWHRIKRDSEKLARRVQKRRVMTTPAMEAPLFWTSVYLQKLRTSEELGECLAAVGKGSATPRQISIILCVICCFFALHGQRRCVAEEVRISEVTAAVRHHGRFVLRVSKHKTTLDTGAANLALQESQFAVMLAYANARAEKCSADGALLRTLDGKGVRSPFEPLLEFVRARSHFPDRLTFNTFRKAIETCKKYAGGEISGAQCDQIHSYLKHGRAVTRQHYEFQSDAVICGQAREVENALFQEALFQAVQQDALPGLLPSSALGQ